MKFFILFTLLVCAFAHNKNALEIHFFTVGNADSQLIVFPSGYNILIDCGDYDYDGASNTKHVAKRIEKILGHKTIDVFILSHFHVDHSGYRGHNGIWYLVEKAGYTVKRFIKRNVGYYTGSKLSDCNKSTMVWKYAGQTCSDMIKVMCYAVSMKDKTKLSRVAENAHRCSKTQIVPPDEGAKVTILMRDALGVKSEDSGNKLYRNSVYDDPAVNENDFSICLRIEYFNFTYATCGDLSGINYEKGDSKYHDVETYVAPMMGEVDLYKVSHHGSTTSTNKVWSKTLKPTVSVVSCGDNGHLPEPVPMGHLEKVGSKIYTTGDDCNKSTMKSHPGIIKMGDDVVVTVTKGRSTFKVASPSGKNAKTYKIKTNKTAPEKCRFLEN